MCSVSEWYLVVLLEFLIITAGIAVELWNTLAPRKGLAVVDHERVHPQH